MPSVQWRDDADVAVRDEVAGVLHRLTAEPALGRDGGREGVDANGPPRDRGVGGAIDLDAVFDGANDHSLPTTSYLHRTAVDDEVQSVLNSMRRATLNLTPGDLHAMKVRRERHDDGTVDGVHFDRDAQTPYVIDNVHPPWYAKTFYKVVAVVEGAGYQDERDVSLASTHSQKNKNYVSVYDGVTRYAVNTTVCHPSGPNHTGGLYVSPTIEGCLRRDRDLFPEMSALLGAKRAIAKVRCWNPDREDDPIFYGSKLAFTCVHVDEILPYPVTWGIGTPPKKGRVGVGAKVGSPSPGKKGHGSSPGTSGRKSQLNQFEPSVYSPGSSPGSAKKKNSPAASPSGADVARAEQQYHSLLRTQAKTVQLEEEVRAMERRLERTKFGSGKIYR